MARQVVKTETPDFNEPLTPELLGKFIRARRTQDGIDMNTAAMMSGVSIATLHRIENGNERTTLAAILKVCNTLGVRLMVEPWDETDA